MNVDNENISLLGHICDQQIKSVYYQTMQKYEISYQEFVERSKTKLYYQIPEIQNNFNPTQTGSDQVFEKNLNQIASQINFRFKEFANKNMANISFFHCDSTIKSTVTIHEDTKDNPKKSNILIKPIVQCIKPLPLHSITSEISQFNIKSQTNITNTKKRKIEVIDINYYVHLAIDINNKNITGLEYDEKIIIVDKNMFYNWYCSLRNSNIIDRRLLFMKFSLQNLSNRVCECTIKKPTAAKKIYFIRLQPNNIFFLENNVEKKKYLRNIMNYSNMNTTNIYTHRDWGFVDQKYFITI
jgi:hypothetical protein